MMGDRQLTSWQIMLFQHFNCDCEGLQISGVTSFIVKISKKVILYSRFECKVKGCLFGLDFRRVLNLMYNLLF